MMVDMHYYATYCAAFMAGWSHEDALAIGYGSAFTDCCSEMLLYKLNAPKEAATMQLTSEMADIKMDLPGLQKITRIWASFHFLPGDLYADPGRGGRRYKNKYRLICNPNSDLLEATIELAKDESLQAIGVAMHVLADTWSHRYFAGTPSLVINNITKDFVEEIPEGDGYRERPLIFSHNPAAANDPEKAVYKNSIYQGEENSIMNIGHGRVGHVPDYSFIRYKYMPAWGKYGMVLKDNPADYMSAFCQMIAALRYLRGDTDSFAKGDEDRETPAPYLEEIDSILRNRVLDNTERWKAFAEKLAGREIETFDVGKYQKEYVDADIDAKQDTFLGRYFSASMTQKAMVTTAIYNSGSLLAGVSTAPTTNISAFKEYANMFNKKMFSHKKGRDKK